MNRKYMISLYFTVCLSLNHLFIQGSKSTGVSPSPFTPNGHHAVCPSTVHLESIPKEVDLEGDA